MIALLYGEPVLAGDRWVVIDVHGVGYQVLVTQPALQQLANTHEMVKLYTHMAVREDAITLYGFLHQSELEMFRILIGVTGIGPQIAMNLLSRIGIEEFAIAIHDAIGALVSLGFQENESRDAVNAAARAPGTPSVQGLIKAALVRLKER